MKKVDIKKYLILSTIFLPNIALACMDPKHVAWNFLCFINFTIFILFSISLIYLLIKKSGEKKIKINLIALFILLPLVLVKIADWSINAIHSSSYEKIFIEKCIKETKAHPEIMNTPDIIFGSPASSVEEYCQRQYSMDTLPTTGGCDDTINNLSDWILSKI